MEKPAIRADEATDRGPTGMAARYDALHRVETPAAISAKAPDYVGQVEAIVLDLIRQYGGALLDAGCGRGTLSIHAHAGFTYRLGVDFSPYFLKEAVARAEAFGVADSCRIEFMAHDLNEPLPIADEVFDAVVSVACLEHVFDVYGFLSEVSRTMKPGAALILQVPNIAYFRHRFHLLVGRLPVTASNPSLWWRDYWDGTHIHYFTLDSLRMLLSHVGLSYRRVTGSGRFRSLRAWWPTMLTADLIVVAQKPRADEGQ